MPSELRAASCERPAPVGTRVDRSPFLAAVALFENTKDEKPDEGACYIDPKSSEASLLGGLYALGVVYPGEQTFGFTKLHFAPHAAQLIALLKT